MTRARVPRLFCVTPRRLVAARLAQPAFEKLERVKPERVDLDRLSAARRHDPIAHLRVHPGELVTLLLPG